MLPACWAGTEAAHALVKGESDGRFVRLHVSVGFVAGQTGENADPHVSHAGDGCTVDHLIADQHPDRGVRVNGGVVGHLAERGGNPLRPLQVEANAFD
jgi:hypothetical protein